MKYTHVKKTEQKTDKKETENQSETVIGASLNFSDNQLSDVNIEHSLFSSTTENGVTKTNKDTIFGGISRNPITQSYNVGYANERTNDNGRTKQTKEDTVELNAKTEGGESNYDVDISHKNILDMKNGAKIERDTNYHLGFIKGDGQGITGGNFFWEKISDDTAMDGWTYFECQKIGGGYKNNADTFGINLSNETETDVNNNDIEHPNTYHQDSNYKIAYERDKNTGDKTFSANGDHNHSSEDDNKAESASNSFEATYTTGDWGQSFNGSFAKASEYLDKKTGTGTGYSLNANLKLNSTEEGTSSSGSGEVEKSNITRKSDEVSPDGKERKIHDQKGLAGGNFAWDIGPDGKLHARIGKTTGKTDTYTYNSEDFTAKFNNTNKINKALVIDGDYAGVGLSFTKEIEAEVNKLKASGKLTAGADLLTNGQKVKVNFFFEQDSKSNSGKIGNKGDNNKKYSIDIDEDGQISLSYRYTTESEKNMLIRELTAFKKEGGNYGFYFYLGGTFN